ncbi:hypothetical protein JCM10213v2_001260 [Rhodosporidiobolus nylandii]
MSLPPQVPPGFDPTAPRHPNDAAPGRITKGGSLLTGGYLAHKIYVGNLPERQGATSSTPFLPSPSAARTEYVDGAHAAEAVAKYNEGHFLGSQIKVELSLARAPANKTDMSRGPPRSGPNNEPFPPGSDRPSDARKPMWINGPPGQDARGGPGRGRDSARDRFDGPPPPGYGGGGYGARYGDRPPIDRPGYGPPVDRYGPPPRGADFRGPPPPAGYGPPVDRPPYDPYYDRGAPRPDYPPYPPPPGAAVGYPPSAPYDRPPYPVPVAPLAGAVPPARDPYADRYPGPPPPGRSPVVAAPDAARAPYAPAPLDPYAPPASTYDPRDDRGAGSRYQPYPPRDGGRSPTRGGPPPERRRSLSPRRGGPPDSYRDAFPPPSNGYAPYGAPPPGAGGYGAPPSAMGRSPPRYPPADEYNPRR